MLRARSGRKTVAGTDKIFHLPVWPFRVAYRRDTAGLFFARWMTSDNQTGVGH
jgi:hypothetical protein